MAPCLLAGGQTAPSQDDDDDDSRRNAGKPEVGGGKTSAPALSGQARSRLDLIAALTATYAAAAVQEVSRRSNVRFQQQLKAESHRDAPGESPATIQSEHSSSAFPPRWGSTQKRQTNSMTDEDHPGPQSAEAARKSRKNLGSLARLSNRDARPRFENERRAIGRSNAAERPTQVRARGAIRSSWNDLKSESGFSRWLHRRPNCPAGSRDLPLPVPPTVRRPNPVAKVVIIIVIIIIISCGGTPTRILTKRVAAGES